MPVRLGPSQASQRLTLQTFDRSTEYAPASASIMFPNLEIAAGRHDSRPTDLFLGDFSAPSQNFRFCSGGFGFLDVAGAVVKQRKTGPADLVVRF